MFEAEAGKRLALDYLALALESASASALDGLELRGADGDSCCAHFAFANSLEVASNALQPSSTRIRHVGAGTRNSASAVQIHNFT